MTHVYSLSRMHRHTCAHTPSWHQPYAEPCRTAAQQQAARFSNASSRLSRTCPRPPHRRHYACNCQPLSPEMAPAGQSKTVPLRPARSVHVCEEGGGGEGVREKRLQLARPLFCVCVRACGNTHGFKCKHEWDGKRAETEIRGTPQGRRHWQPLQATTDQEG